MRPTVMMWSLSASFFRVLQSSIPPPRPASAWRGPCHIFEMPGRQVGFFQSAYSLDIMRHMIYVDPKRKRQMMRGVGGAFTDAATIKVDDLSEAARYRLLEAYFGENGWVFFCRNTLFQGTLTPSAEYPLLELTFPLGSTHMMTLPMTRISKNLHCKGRIWNIKYRTFSIFFYLP